MPFAVVRTGIVRRTYSIVWEWEASFLKGECPYTLNYDKEDNQYTLYFWNEAIVGVYNSREDAIRAAKQHHRQLHSNDP